MMKDSFIETGVDKLVQLIETKKRLTLEQAAKELGVSLSVLEEWADFLEEEGIITIDYKLTSTELVARKLSDKEIEHKAKEFHGKKEGFVRKMEGAIVALERDTENLDKLKAEFKELQQIITNEVDHIKDKLVQLEKYENIKKHIDEQLLDQHVQFKKRVSEIERDILQEEKRYQEIVNNVEIARVKIEEEKSHASTIYDQEHKIEEKLVLLERMVHSVRDQLKSEDKEVRKHEEQLDRLLKLASAVREEVKSKRDNLKALVEESRHQEQNILKSQQTVLEEFRDKKHSGNEEIKRSNEIIDKLERFFKKKNEINTTLEKVLRERHDLETEMQEILKKARAIELASSKNGPVKAQIAELEKHYRELEKKKGFFSKELDKLRGLFSP